jgi:hypothetical protein
MLKRYSTRHALRKYFSDFFDEWGNIDESNIIEEEEEKGDEF